MNNQLLTAESAIEKAHEYFDQRNFSMALQHFEYANRINANEQTIIGIILTNLIINQDFGFAIQRVSSLQYPEDTLFKAYRAVIAQFYYMPDSFYNYDQKTSILTLNKTRIYIERYLTSNFNTLFTLIGQENANTIRIMLLKLLFKCYNSILFGKICVSTERLADTYNIKTEGRSLDYGYFSDIRLNTSVEAQQNFSSQYMRNIDFIGENKNELNFQLRCNEILEEIHKVDASFNLDSKYSVPNINYLMGGYLKYKTHNNYKKASKRKAISGGFFLWCIAASIMLTLINSVAVETTPFLNYFRLTCIAGGVISFIIFIKERASKRKWEKGEYEVSDGAKIKYAHSDL